MIKFFKFIFVLFLMGLPFFCNAQDLSFRLSGQILLQAENKGQLWYVSQVTNSRYELNHESIDEFFISNSLGVLDKDLENIKTLDRLRGRFLLQVQNRGQIIYVDNNLNLLKVNNNNFKIVLGRNAIGISDENLYRIPMGGKSELVVQDNKKYKNKILHKVPFYSQAPLGNWQDKRQAYGCEETSVIMAMNWVNNINMSLQEVESKIISISDYEKNLYGIFEDTSINDTYERIVKGYFNYNNAIIKSNISIQDIIDELYNGNIILVPVNGQVLNNYHYTPPGPFEHMLVVVGYDSNGDKIIAHDPGTQYGQNYEFDKDNFARSIQDYTSGFRLSNPLNTNSIIIFSK